MSEHRDIFIVKSNGERERFSFDKLEASLVRSGANTELAKEVTAHVEKEAVNGMTTGDIYRHAFSILHARERSAAVRYSLRRSLLALGPTGFPFEKFVGEVLKRRGYQVLLDQTLLGHCVDHEMDIVAWNAEKLMMIEAKYHHELAYKSDVKVVLYVKSRFDDLYAASFSYGNRTKLDEGWLITNTKFTDKAIKYAQCSGVKLVGWNYPERGNLHDLIATAGIHPITCLTTLSFGEKQTLMEQGIVLCEDFIAQKAKLKALGWGDEQI